MATWGALVSLLLRVVREERSGLKCSGRLVPAQVFALATLILKTFFALLSPVSDALAGRSSINFHGDVVSKKYTTLFYFAIGGLLGPLVWWVSKSSGMAVAFDYTVAMLWPTWSLATFEYSLGQPWAGLIAIGANILLFMLIGVFSLMSASVVWRAISFASICFAFIWLNYWLNDWDVLSLLVAVAVVAVLYCLTGRQACQLAGSRKTLDQGY